jgi:hypothetical protein
MNKRQSIRRGGFFPDKIFWIALQHVAGEGDRAKFNWLGLRLVLERKLRRLGNIRLSRYGMEGRVGDKTRPIRIIQKAICGSGILPLLPKMRQDAASTMFMNNPG